MAEDYYKTLGVARDASQADIQKAHRKLARKYHPDMNPGDKGAKDKFQKVQTAFDVLNDPGKRELYDRYGSSFESMGAGGQRGSPTGGGGATFDDFDFSQFFGERYAADPSGGFGDIFGQFRRAGSGRTRKGRTANQAGADVQAEVQVPFQTAVTGGQVELQVQRASGKVDTIAVKIPPGIHDGGKIRLRGQGEAAEGAAAAGDLLLTVHVAQHPFFSRRGNHLDVKVPVTLSEAVAGARIDVPAPKGTITLRVPPMTSSGTKLRVRGHGVSPAKGEPGDLYAEIQIVLPATIDEKSLEAIKRLDEQSAGDPRAELRW